MSFDVTADAYDRFMGRFSGPLAERFVELIGVRAGAQRVGPARGSRGATDRAVRGSGPDRRRGPAVDRHRKPADFDTWWAPFTLGVGPAGAHVARLDEDQRDELPFVDLSLVNELDVLERDSALLDEHGAYFRARMPANTVSVRVLCHSSLSVVGLPGW